MTKFNAGKAAEIFRIAERVVNEAYVDGTNPRKAKVLDFYDPESLSLLAYDNDENADVDDEDGFDLWVDDDEEEDDAPEPKKERKLKSPKKKKSKAKNKNKEKKKKPVEEENEQPVRIFIPDNNRISDLERREIKVDMVHLLTERDRIKRELGKLDVGKKKQATKIAQLNIDLCQIDEDLRTLESISGEAVPELNQGSRISRFFNGVKRKVKKACTKVKKFFNRNSESIIGLSAITLPVMLGLGARILLRLF